MLVIGPDAGSYLERARSEDQKELANSIASFLTWAPTPDYDNATPSMPSPPIVVEASAPPASRRASGRR